MCIDRYYTEYGQRDDGQQIGRYEWLVWVAFAMIALGGPHGWLRLGVPAFLFLLLFRVTGIPATEAQALRSRGEDYRRYREEVPMFVPRPPRRTT